MKFSIWNHKLEEADDGSKGASGGKPEAKPDTKPSTDNSSTQGEGGEFDDLGYPIVKPAQEGKEKSTGGDDKTPKSEQEEEVKEPATGYGDEEPKVDEIPEPKEDKAPVEKDSSLGFDLDVKGLTDKLREQVVDFAKKHSLTKEAAQALVDQRREELTNLQKEIDRKQAEAKVEAQKVRANWHKELKADPKFGGENFSHNVKRVEKVLDQYLPNIKKRLTETGAALPPYIMRDLASLADRLFATEKLVQGDSGNQKPQDDKDADDPLSFYNS